VTNPMHRSISLLMDGNRRFINNQSTADNSEYVRIAIASRQKPIAGVLSCADSRLPPEIIFDQGLGSLFVVRTAGAVVDAAVIGSLEFGVSKLKIPVIMVLGHKRCGAMKAALDAEEGTGQVPGKIAFLVDVLHPALEAARIKGGELLENATKIHVRNMAGRLAESPVLHEAIENGRLEITLGWYDLDSGEVDIQSR
jgi:carbonic anhydrase